MDSLCDSLDALALQSLQWAHAHRGEFELPDDIADHDAGHDLNWTVKPLGELAQLSVSIRRACSWANPATARAATDLLEFCWRQTRQGDALLELFRGEPHATYPLEIYAAFAEGGLRSPALEAFARVACSTRGWLRTEQDPNRRLGILRAEQSAGLVPHAPFEEALRRTWLGGRPEPWTFDQSAGYHLTHTVFHITGWGAEPDRMPGDLDGYLRDWLPAWLDGCLEAEQWDLSCELLAVASSLPSEPLVEAVLPAWERLAAARGADGSLPETGAAPEPDDPGLFAAGYHSTLAAAFAATLTTARLRPAPASEGAQGSTDGRRTPHTAPGTGRKDDLG